MGDNSVVPPPASITASTPVRAAQSFRDVCDPPYDSETVPEELSQRLQAAQASRFQRGKQVASYLGLIPSEHGSSRRRRLEPISKQGNPFVRMLLVESVQAVNRLEEGFRKQYQHRCHRNAKGVAKVAAARRLAVRLYWMLRSNTPYPEIARIESSSRNGVVGAS